MIVYLGGNRADLWRTVARVRQSGEATVVSTGGRSADDADVDALSAEINRCAASASVIEHRVGYARESAWRWIEDVALRRPTAIGATLFELMRDEDDAPLWWISDITLQEKAFLVVRFIETLDFFLRTLQPTAVVICGADRDHPWQRPVFAQWARTRKVAIVSAARQEKGGDQNVGPDPRGTPQSRDDVPIPEVERPGMGQPVEVAAHIQPAAALDIALRLVELTLTPLAAVVGALALMVVGTASAIAPASVVAQQSIRVARGLTFGVLAIVLGIILFIPLVLILFVAGIVVVVTAERADAIVDRKQLLSSLSRLDRRSLLTRSPSRDATRQGAVEPLVLVVVDRGDERQRVAVDSRRRSSYNSYLEGVVTALRAAARSHRVVVAQYGSQPGGRAARIARRLRRLVRPGEASVADAINPALWRAANRWSRVDAETGRWVADPKGLGQVLEYEGVPVLDALRSELGTVFAIQNERRLYVEAFRRLIRAIRPSVIVAYNWEGVFRPLTEAAYRERVTLFGVQQALGPYGHAIDHRTAGYVRPGETGDGFRIPNRLAIWGAIHAETLERYGLPGDVPVVTGYPRLDPFVTVRPDRRALRRRLRISDPNAKLVVFSAVLRVIGTPLVRESSYIQMFDELVSITALDPAVYIVAKPWGGDDMVRLRQIVWSRGNRNVRFLAADTDIHNADLLSGAEVLVGTFSSIVGEAVVAGCIPIMVNPPEARYYFGDEHIAHYDGLARTVEDPVAVRAAVLEELGRPAEDRERIRSAALRRVERVFGPVDGGSAARVAAEVLRAARRR